MASNPVPGLDVEALTTTGLLAWSRPFHSDQARAWAATSAARAMVFRWEKKLLSAQRMNW